MLTNKERPGANTWRSLQVEQVEVMLLYCHVSHLITEKKLNALQGLIYPHINSKSEISLSLRLSE